MKFSFIIPALNEEKNIKRAIGQFSKISEAYLYEIIVADGNSKDKTVEIAKRLGARVCIDRSKKKTIASGRNLGAKIAHGEILVFCDADTSIKDIDYFCMVVELTFKDKGVVAAMPKLKVFPKERIWKDKLFHTCFNVFIRSSLFIKYPFSSGQCQIVTSKAFKKVKGYNPRQVHAEDSDLFQRLNRIGRLRYLSRCTVYESARRYRKIGYLRLMWIAIKSIVGQKIFKKNMLNEWKRVD